jgi:DNA-binding CsgD family transcriptional regulator
MAKAPERGHLSDALVGAIYESLLRDDTWSGALELLRRSLSSSMSCLRVIQKGSNPREYLFAAGPKVNQEAIAEWERDNIRGSNVDMKLGEVMVFNWADTRSADATTGILDRYDIIRAEIGTQAATCVMVTEDTEYVLTCMRDGEASPYRPDELALLRDAGSHFNRALRIRYEIESARVVNEFQAQALDRLAISAILVEQGGRTTLLNRTAEKLLSGKGGLQLTGGKLRAADRFDDRTFQEAMKAVLASTSEGISRAVSIKRGEGERDIGVVVTARKFRSLVTSRPENCAIVFTRTAEALSDADISLFQELFSFTKAEARLAIALASGMRLEDVERELKIRHNTARAHLRSMFSKAEVGRQSELVHLLMNSVVPLGRSRESAADPLD